MRRGSAPGAATGQWRQHRRRRAIQAEAERARPKFPLFGLEEHLRSRTVRLAPTSSVTEAGLSSSSSSHMVGGTDAKSDCRNVHIT